MENEKQLMKLVLESSCIVHALLDDYSRTIATLTNDQRQLVMARVLGGADVYVKKLQEVNEPELTHSVL
jgi:hypothetical protein